MVNEGPGTWSAYEVVAHMTYLEGHDWIQRVEHVLEFGESRPLPAVDPNGFKGGDVTKSLGVLLMEFTARRGASLQGLAALPITSVELERLGVHPALGKVSLSQLLSAWVVHDLNHLAQIARVLAKQYGEAVGPWGEYFTVLKR